MLDLAPTRHRPRLLAFIRTWDSGESFTHICMRLAQLDCELVVVCDAGTWEFDRDREPTFRASDEADVAKSRDGYRVTGDALIVIDHRGTVRFEHRPARPLGATLTEALDAAAQAMQWRDHQSKLERVQWTPREWSMKSIVVGCSLTFIAAPPRLARGTGPIQKYESRELISPRAETGAPAPQSSAIGESPSDGSRGCDFHPLAQETHEKWSR